MQTAASEINYIKAETSKNSSPKAKSPAIVSEKLV
jgi:hypothetical protein